MVYTYVLEISDIFHLLKKRMFEQLIHGSNAILNHMYTELKEFCQAGGKILS